MTLHLLTGEFGTDAGGVGAYSYLLADALRVHGVPVRVWSTLDPSLRSALPAALKTEPGFVLLQYVPNALGVRGANIGFCQWLLSLRRDGVDVRVMFHEPYFYLSWNPALNALAMVQRLMAGILLRASTRTYISTSQWHRYLAPYAPAGASFTVLPIPSTLPVDPSPRKVAEWRQRLAARGADRLVGHFGTYGDHVASVLAPMIPDVLSRSPDVGFVCIGRGGETFAARLRQEHPALASRLQATGALDRDDAASAIAACDVALQPYPDGVTTRRTSVMAPLALGVATVSSAGFLTEPAWTEAPSVSLAEASDGPAHVGAVASLLQDVSLRQQLGTLGRRFYKERFSIEGTVKVLAADAAPA